MILMANFVLLTETVFRQYLRKWFQMRTSADEVIT